MGAENSALGIECLVATCGLYPSKPIDSGDVATARKIPREIEAEIRAFFDDTKGRRPEKSPDISYLSTWRRLNTKQNDQKIAILIRDPEVQDAYVAKLNEVRAYVRGQWRPSKIVTMLGDRLLPPSTSEDARARDLYAMGNDPHRIVRRLQACCIMAEEIALIRAVFPEIYAMIGLFLDQEMFRRRALRKSYEVPYRQEVAIKAYVGESAASEVETINAESAPPEQSAPPEFDIATSDNRRRDGMTKADRVEEGNASG